LVKAIILALNQSSFGRFWEQPTGAAFRDQSMVKYGLVGCADITGLTTFGIRAEIEVKTGQAQQSDQQKNFEFMIKKYKGIYFVARSVEDALQQIQIAVTSSA
jgi:hypothetical protein